MHNPYRFPPAVRWLPLSVALLSNQDTMPLPPSGITFRRVREAFDLRPSDDLLLLHGTGMAQKLKGFATDAQETLPPVVVIAPRLDWGDIALALELGATGYLLEHLRPQQLGTALACISEGFDVLAPVISTEQTRLASLARGAGPVCSHLMPTPTKLLHLSPRERQVMDLIAAGREVRQVAQELVLTEKSVRNYLDRVYRKLGVRNRTAAILCWLGHTAGGDGGTPGGLAEPPGSDVR